MAKALSIRLSRQKKISDEGVAVYSRILEDIEKYLEVLEAKEGNWSRLEKVMRQNYDRADSTIKLNVRGKMFETLKENLVRIEGTYFHCLISSSCWLPADNDGAYFIDRRYEGFARILDYLATDNLSYADLTRYECEVIEDNLDYFLLRDAPRPPPLPTFKHCELVHGAPNSSRCCKKQILHPSNEIFGQYKICQKQFCVLNCKESVFHFE